MKQLLTTVLLICTFGLVGCGGSSPGDAVKDLSYAMEAGDVDKVKELMPELSENLGDSKIETLVKQAAKEAEENGGIKSITIDKEEIDGDKAKVTATMTDGNDKAETETFDLVKKDGKWTVTLGEEAKSGGAPSIDPSDFGTPPAE